ncbi:MAG: VWA domain-containing protein [Deltaproteobacteria bacterium]|nr:MAG: VWA domain-containing protein [Deltaproteobacteria bacterium]
MRRRKSLSPFNLSFLDIMFCGFGAVVLLVLVINADTLRSRNEQHEDLRAEVMRQELEVKAGQEHLVELKNSVRATNDQVSVTQGRSEEVLLLIKEVEIELADLQNKTLARKEHINELQSDLKNLDKENHRLGAELKADQEKGRKVRRFEGEGNRQYLTGLKLGGKRVLVLLDVSASMLDRTIVNVIRRRNMDEATKRSSPKWQQARKTVEWLIANLPPDSSLQVQGFNTEAFPLLPETSGKWIPVTDGVMLGKVVGAMNDQVPASGTSLAKGFKAAAGMLPRPDNILLITDGLPTQGSGKSLKKAVPGEQRVKYFQKAVKLLPKNIPVNTILFPMEGDPMAAVLFWKLAVDTGGSFLTPTSDWP